MKINYPRLQIKSDKKGLLPLFLLLPVMVFFQCIPKTAFAQDENKALMLLQKMNQAVNQLDYQIYFTLQNNNQESATFEYSHFGSSTKNGVSARLAYLEGPLKEIILHNGITAYFQTNNSSFSIASSRITEAFPDIIYSDLNQIAHVYDFILLGKMRTANRSAELVKVVAKNKDLYHYVIWIDTETLLPIRIDLFNLHNELIQQLKVVSLNLNFDKAKERSLIDNRDIPILLAIEEQRNPLNKWKIAWIPEGFNEIPTYNVSFYNANTTTKFFTDGIFSFAITISENDLKQPNKIIKIGERTIFSTHVNDFDVMIIGDLPLITIERIVQNITQNSQ